MLQILQNNSTSKMTSREIAELTGKEHKTPEQIQRCAELQSKADKAALNVKHAVNKNLAVRTFLQFLYLSI